MTEMVPATNAPLPVRLRVEDYMMLDEAGAFEAYGKTELIDGEIVYMNSQHRPHARIKSRLHVLLAKALEARVDGLEAIVKPGVLMPPHNVPEPDIVVTDAPEGKGLIPLESVRLIVEVSDTTLRTDLSRKAAIYARHGVPEHWVVDVEHELIHRMASPSTDRFNTIDRIAFGDPIAATTIAGLTVETNTL